MGMELNPAAQIPSRKERLAAAGFLPASETGMYIDPATKETVSEEEGLTRAARYANIVATLAVEPGNG